MTVRPNGSPAYALPSHQPTCCAFSGTRSSPSKVVAGFTAARTPPGRTTVSGTKCTRSVRPGRPNRTDGTEPGSSVAAVRPGAGPAGEDGPAEAPQPASQPTSSTAPTPRASRRRAAGAGAVLLNARDGSPNDR